MEGPSTSGEPKVLTGVTAGKQSLALLFLSPSLVTPLVWRRDLSKWISSHFLKKLNFSTHIPFPRLVRISWHHPAKERHLSLRQRSQWQVGTVLTTGSHNLQMSHNVLSHLRSHVFPNLQPDLIQIQRMF